MLTSRALSLSCIRWTGMPVIIETTSATLSASTSTRLLSSPRSISVVRLAVRVPMRLACRGSWLQVQVHQFCLPASRFFRSASSNCFFSSIISGGTWAFCRCTRAPTSSSHRWLCREEAVGYVAVCQFDTCVMASSVYETW